MSSTRRRPVPFHVRGQFTLADVHDQPAAERAIEHAITDLATYEEALHLVPSFVLEELLPHGVRLTNRLEGEAGLAFAADLRRVLLGRWQKARRLSATTEAFDAAVRAIVATLAEAGLPMDEDGARTLLGMYARQRHDLVDALLERLDDDGRC